MRSPRIEAEVADEMPLAMRDPIVRKLLEAQGFLELRLPGRALEVLRSRDDWAAVQFEASYLTGEALRQLGRFREALAPLEVAAGLRPGDPGVAIAQGWCYKRSHRLAQAIDALQRVGRDHPEHPVIGYNLACYWSLAGDHGRALDELAAALERRPELRALIPDEADFDPIRHLPAFDRLAAPRAGRAPRDDE